MCTFAIDSFALEVSERSRMPRKGQDGRERTSEDNGVSGLRPLPLYTVLDGVAESGRRTSA